MPQIDLLAGLSADLASFLPRLVSAAIVVAVAYPLIRYGSSRLKSSLVRMGRAEAVAGLASLLVSVLLYYSLALAVMAILGLSALASSLGTAVGFIGLGVAYAMKDVIAEVVAGVYLIRDPDFSQGDQVVTGEGSGLVSEVGLRKTRIDTPEGDRLVVSNASVEKKWTRKGSR